MKNKLFFCVLATILLTETSKAQRARIEGGINFANISVTNDGRVNNANMLTSFRVGIIGDFPLASIVYLQPGIVYTGKGSKVQNGTQGTSGYYKQTFNPFYIEVPVNLVFKTPSVKGNRFFAGAGPYLAVGINGKAKTEGQIGVATYNTQRDIRFSNDDPTTLNQEEGAGFNIVKRFDYGVNGIAGIEMRSITLSANYGLGLAKLQSGSNSAANNNNKNRVWGVSLGFKL